MTNVAIKVEGLSKQYKIGLAGGRHDTLSDQLAAGFKSLFRRNGSHSADAGRSASSDTIWALKHVSFVVNQGEVVGIIGGNGAGKSTLLKILSRITEPTAGSADIHGRVGSLLEVGTGFHLELTGRENVYLNGAILGMKKAEIDRKFDEIVEFSGVEKFIDTPVKRYSSGMHVRLAFSVAAHLEPEVLIVDEVLAVGDGMFQQKCIKKMQDVGHQGRTVFFVSHNLPVITRLCRRAILLSEGKVIADGPADKVVSSYLNSGLGIGPVRIWEPANAPGADVARLLAVRVRGSDGEIADAVDIRHPVQVEMEYQVLQPGYKLLPNIHFRNELGELLFCSLDIDPAWQQRARPAGRYISSVEVPGNFLAEGTITVTTGFETIDPAIFQFCELDVVAFQVVDNLHPDSARGNYKGVIEGIVRPRLPWKTQLLPSQVAGNGHEPLSLKL